MKILRTGLTALAATLLWVACDSKETTPTPTPPDNGAYVGTVVVDAGGANELTLEEIEVEFTANGGGTTADIEILRVKFAARMPVTIDMMIPGVVLTAAEGGYTLSGEAIVPTYMNGVPYPERTITGLAGTASATTLSFSMMCGEYPLSFSGTREAIICP